MSAGVATSLGSNDTPVAIATETFNCVLGGGDTTVVLTPTNIIAIDYVTFTATGSAAAGTAIYLTNFVVGGPDVTITAPNSATFLATIYGRIG